jgi:hypothetical protein
MSDLCTTLTLNREVVRHARDILLDFGVVHTSDGNCLRFILSNGVYFSFYRFVFAIP